MAKIDKIKIDLEIRRYCIFFFPIASYKKAGEVVIFSFFGMPVYRRVGDKRRLFFTDLADLAHKDS